MKTKYEKALVLATVCFIITFIPTAYIALYLNLWIKELGTIFLFLSVVGLGVFNNNVNGYWKPFLYGPLVGITCGMVKLVLSNSEVEDWINKE